MNVEKFKNIKLDITPKIRGRNVTLSDAVTKTRSLITESNEISINGLGCDLSGIDRILNFSEKNLTYVDHMDGENISSFYNHFQRFGGSISSFGEVARRADLIIFVGENSDLFKNFYKKFILKKKPVFNKNLLNVISTKKKLNFRHDHYKIKKMDYELELMNLFKDFKSARENNPVNKKHKFYFLIKKILKSKYGVIAYQFDHKNHTLNQKIVEFNKLMSFEKKFSLLPIIDVENNLAGAIQSSLWKTGFPNRFKFTENGPDYNPINYSPQKLKKKIELQIFISCFNENPKLELFKRNIFIGNPNTVKKERFDVFIPVSTPGIDQNGLVLRGDGVCTIKLGKLINSQYNSVNEVFRMIDEN